MTYEYICKNCNFREIIYVKSTASPSQILGQAVKDHQRNIDDKTINCRDDFESFLEIINSRGGNDRTKDNA